MIGAVRARISVGAAVALALALAVGCLAGWLLFADRGSSRASSRARPTSPFARAVTYPAIGLAFGVPSGWRVSVQRSVIRLLSPDQRASLAVSAAAANGREVQLRRADKQQLLKLFGPASTVGRSRGTIGGQPVLTTELIGTSPRHVKIRILSTAVSSRYLTYSVQVFSVLKPTAGRLLEIRNMLGSFRFFAPKK